MTPLLTIDPIKNSQWLLKLTKLKDVTRRIPNYRN